MKKRKFIAMTVLAVSLSLFGCGATEQPNAENDPNAYLYSLTDGVFYIRHSGNECEPLYHGECTFNKGEINTNITPNRIMWFREDWEKIPTLYKGDSLILYTESDMNEYFVFERFDDIGYSIGMRGFETRASGRLQLSTDIERKLTYPNSDADEINKFKTAYVTIETLGGVILRDYSSLTQDSDKKDEDNVEEDFTRVLTRYGTIRNLVEGETYTAEVYTGTVRHEMQFKADVRILGDYEAIARNNYEFESERIIVIEIPDWIQSGYYMINGQGIFRYVNGTSYDDTTDFSIPNVAPEDVPNVVIDYSNTEFYNSEEGSKIITPDENGQYAPNVDLNKDGTPVIKDDDTSTNSILDAVKDYMNGNGTEDKEEYGTIKLPYRASLTTIKDGTAEVSTPKETETGSFELEISGMDKVMLSVSLPWVDDLGKENISIELITPDGELHHEEAKEGDSEISFTFKVKKEGTYYLYVKNLPDTTYADVYIQEVTWQ